MRRIVMLASWLLLCGLPSNAQSIHTFAGGGPGSGIPALSANLNQPIRVALDSSGNYYFSGYGQNRIFKVDSTGTLTVIAGTGLPGFSGDGGPATNAALNSPVGVTLDAAGNLFISDYLNHRIRKVDATTHNISTVAGTGAAGYNGDGGQASSATLNYPIAVAVDVSGNLFIADKDNHRIRKVDAATHNISTVAGTGTLGYNGDGIPATSANLYYPIDLVVTGGGNLYLADYFNNRIRKVDGATHLISTVAGNGSTGFNGDGIPATSATLYNPTAIALDASGNVLIADTSNNRIRKVNSGGTISTIAGTGVAGYNGSGLAATSSNLNSPWGVTTDSTGLLFIADRNNNRVRKVDSAGKLFDVAGNGLATFGGDGGLATGASLYTPTGVTEDAAGNVYIADYQNHRIRKVEATTHIITTVAGTGGAGYNGDGIAATSATLYYPSAVAVDANGNLYIADNTNHRIRKVDAITHTISTVVGTGSRGYNGDGIAATSANLYYPYGVAFDTAGNLYVADYFNHRIRKVDAITQTISTVAGTGAAGYNGDGIAATSATLNYPIAVAVDGAGNLYVADYQNQRIRKVDATTHTISTVAGTGGQGYNGDGIAATSATLNNPIGVAVDGAGNIYVADDHNNRVRKVDAITHKISTVAGNGIFGFSGDGGPATSAGLATPWGVSLDSAGNLFIADYANSRIRKVDVVAPAPAVTLSSSSLNFGHSPVGTQTVAQSMTVTNSGSAALHISSVAASGDYVESDDCTAGPVAPSGHCTVQVSFLPTALGTRTGALSITDDAGSSPQSVSLTGIGDPASTMLNISAPPVTYPADGLVTVTVSSAAGTVTGNVSLSVDGGSAITHVLSSESGLFTLSGLAAGDHSLSANYAAQGSFAAGSNTGTLHVDKGNQTITFVAPASPATYNTSFGVAPTSSSSLTVSVGASGVCSISGGTVTMTSGTGTCTLTASQAGDSNYSAATDAVQMVKAQKASQTITFVPPASPATYNTSFGVAPTSNSGLSVGVSASGVCSISGGTVTMTSGAGTCTLTAAQAGDSNYSAATDVVQTVTAQKASQTITFAAPASPANFNSSFGISPTASSSLTVSVAASGVCSIAGNSVTMTSGTGACILTASQAGDSNYSAATDVVNTVTAQKIDQTITFTGAPATAAFNTTFGVTASDSSGLAVTLGASGACSISGATVTMTSGTGTCSLAADQAGDANFNAAPHASQSTSALRAAATVTLSNLTQTYTGSTLSPSASTTPPNLTINWTGAPDTSAGNYPVTATVNDSNYQGSASDTFAINRANSVVTWANPANITYGTALGAGQLNATASVPGSFSYAPAVGTVLNVGSGQNLSVTFTPNDTANYNSASKSVVINVNPAPLTITANNASKVLDAPNPAFTATYGGLVLGQGPLSPGVLSGTLSCTTPATTTSPVGAYPITCSGQSSSNYSIQYVAGNLKVNYAPVGTACYGDLNHSILQPINLDGTSVFKQKSTVPAKFRVCDANGFSVGTPGAVSAFNLVQIVSGTVVQTVTEAVDSTTPDASFRWDATGQQWIFNISSKNMSANVTYVFQITLNDGTTIPFQFGLK